MNTLREAAQAAPDAKVRAQHKEFARWFLELGDKSALASEYLAWLAWKAALAHPPRDEWREAAEEALRWMEHARLHLTIKERMHPDGLSLYDSAAEALRAALAKPETDAGVSWDGHNVRGDADSIAEVRRLIDFEQARQGAKPATGDDLRVYDAIAANYVNAEPEPVVIGPEWTPCVKLPVTVHVREQRPGEQHVSTREGITPVKPDDLIMRGVAGEEYPIGRELFGRTYRIGANPPRDEWRPASELDTLRELIGLAYGHLWMVNNEPGTPNRYSPERAAYEARKLLRDTMTQEQRGAFINRVIAQRRPPPTEGK